MANNDKIAKHRDSTKSHQRSTENKHAYLLRIPQRDFEKLQVMAGDEPMSRVLLDGLQVEWIYYQTVLNLMKKLPDFDSTEQMDKWLFNRLKGYPELLAKCVPAATIKTYLVQLEQHNKLSKCALIQRNSITYYLNRIGNNLNQLTHKANQGFQVDLKELRLLTKATIELSELIEQEFKESENDVCEK